MIINCVFCLPCPSPIEPCAFSFWPVSIASAILIMWEWNKLLQDGQYKVRQSRSSQSWPGSSFLACLPIYLSSSLTKSLKISFSVRQFLGMKSSCSMDTKWCLTILESQFPDLLPLSSSIRTCLQLHLGDRCWAKTDCFPPILQCPALPPGPVPRPATPL